MSKQNGRPVSFDAPNDLVFGTEREGKLRTYYGTLAMFRRFLKENELAGFGIHFHALRHTFSNRLFESGENPKAIQMLMGNKDGTTTLQTYTSVDRNYLRQATNLIDKHMKNRKWRWNRTGGFFVLKAGKPPYLLQQFATV